MNAGNKHRLTRWTSGYITTTTAKAPKFLAWVSQLNLTYTPIIVTGPNQGWSYQPPNEVYVGDPAVNEVKRSKYEVSFPCADSVLLRLCLWQSRILICILRHSI
jgi:hypothetical protein